MREEDKKLIKSLKTQCEGARDIFKDTCCQLPISYIEKIIDIVEKQQKEIEKLKQITSLYNSYEVADEERRIVIADSEYFVKGYFKENFISKDKIKAKIKELQEKPCYAESVEGVLEEIDILKELLEE